MWRWQSWIDYSKSYIVLIGWRVKLCWKLLPIARHAGKMRFETVQPLLSRAWTASKAVSFSLSSTMEAIKKKMQAMKVEKDNACDRVDVCEEQCKAARVGGRVVKSSLRTTKMSFSSWELPRRRARWRSWRTRRGSWRPSWTWPRRTWASPPSRLQPQKESQSHKSNNNSDANNLSPRSSWTRRRSSSQLPSLRWTLSTG